MIPEEEYRRHARITQDIPVRWRIDNTERSGDGVIRDISVSGILIELDTFFTPDKNSIFVIQPVNPQDEFFMPTLARLVWAKPLRKEVGKYFCGMEFVRPSESVLAQLSARIEGWFTTIAEAANVNILDNYFHGKNRR
jgi:hypothetical protein